MDDIDNIHDLIAELFPDIALFEDSADDDALCKKKI